MPRKKQSDARSVAISHDANDNVIITGDANKVIIYQTVKQIDVAADTDKEKQNKDIGPNPYLGLGAFQESDADRFFGREKLITILWEKFRDLNMPAPSSDPKIRLLPILGPSGSGKSSLARAGLIPELARHPLPGRKSTRVGVITPGSHPLESLALVLARIATDDPSPALKRDEYKEVIQKRAKEKDYRGLSSIADTLPGIEENPLVILVDQFEETYALCKDENERTVFLENLLQAAADPSQRISVVLTMRSDFIGETQAHTLLNTLVTRQGELVPAMNKDELRDAIAKPAEKAKHPLDEATTDLLIEQTEGREGALPLLQFALTRIWDALPEKKPAETLKGIGGVGGALAGEAQRLYDSLDETGKAIAKRAFLAMVQLGEGTRDTRRRVALEQVVSAKEEEQKVRNILQLFSGQAARLVTFAGEKGKDTIEVTHEALLDHWQELNEWLDGSRDDLRFQRRLEVAARHWDNSGRPDGALWRPPDLDLLGKFYKDKKNYLNDLQQIFYRESEKSRKRRRNWVIGIASLVVVLLGYALYSNNQQRIIAEEKTWEANYNLAQIFEIDAGLALADALAHIDSQHNFQKAWLYTLAALNLDIGKEKRLPTSIGRLVQPELRYGIWHQVWTTSRRMEGVITSVAFSPDGTRIASGSTDNTVRLWDVATGEVLSTFSGHSSYVYSVAFSPDGTRIASGSLDNTIRLWDVATGEVLSTFSGHSSSVTSVVFSPDGTRIASGSEDRTIRLWDVATGEVLSTFSGHNSSVTSVAFSPDGTRIASGSLEETVHLWDVATGEALSTFRGHSSDVTSVAFSPDGTRIASGSGDRTIRLWDVATGEALSTFSGHSSSVTSVAFSPDGDEDRLRFQG